MTKKICKNCTHWEKNNCDCDKFVYEGYDEPPIDGLVYWDYESYSAGFETGEQFGCIHFKRGE